MATVPVRDGVWSDGRQEGSKRRIWLKGATALAVGLTGAWWMWGRGEPVPETGAMSGIVTHLGPSGTTVEGAAAIAQCRARLKAAQVNLANVQTISAEFHKQERINDKLQPLNVMDLKVRRSPLSIYMQWQKPDAGQQVLWLDGAHEGKILVSPAGWKRKLVPMVKIAPDDDMAKAVSRRPVTNIGIWNFTDRILDLFEQELLKDPSVAVRMTKGQEISDRPCTLFTFEHAQPSGIVQFKQVQIFIDDVLGVPVACEHYRWVTGGNEAHLEESYLYKDLAVNVELKDSDFDHTNPALKFGVK